MEDDGVLTIDSPLPPPPEVPKPQETEPTSAAVPKPQEADPTSAPPPSSSSPDPVILTDELRQKIIRQVEYYFSDENLPTDKFLMNYVKKDKKGFGSRMDDYDDTIFQILYQMIARLEAVVPIAVVASFRKMKKLVQDDSLVVAALKESSQLVLSSDGKKVKRLHPLPVIEVKDTKSHTVIVENLPENYSVETLQRIFGEVGSIKSICIRDPHATKDPAKVKNAEKISGKLHALVEYETVNAAEKAVTTLNDERNWRSGMRVELLRTRMGKYGLAKMGRKGNTSEKHVVFQASDIERDEQNVGLPDDHDETLGQVEADHVVSEKTERKSRNRGRSRGLKQQTMKGYGRGSVLTGSGSEGANKPPLGPRMPDGTRGFVMGRGRPPSSDHS